MRRRSIILALAAALTLTVSAAAYQVPNLETRITEPYYGLNTDPQDQAEFLHALGLFRGTEEGYALDRSMTRSEAAVMLVRLLGQENAALTQSPSHPFTDVPQWASPYVGWLWTNGLTKGASATTFGSSNSVTAKQYLMFLSRALYGPDVADDYWEAGWGFDLTALQQSLDQAGFLRRDAVSLSVLALSGYTDTGDTLAARLLKEGAISEDDFCAAAPKVYVSDWGTTEDGRLLRDTAGVTLYSTEQGMRYIYRSGDSSNSYVLATRQQDGQAELCAVDYFTLELAAPPASLPLTEGQQIEYYAGTGGDYLVMKAGGTEPTALLYYNGSAVQQLLELTPFCTGMSVPYCSWRTWDGGLLLTLEDYETTARHSWLLDGPTVQALPALDGQDVVDVLGDSVIVRCITDETAVLQQLAIPSMEVLARFELPCTEAPPFPGESGKTQLLRWMIADKTDGYYWGDAGLYCLENGVLHCLQERCVRDLLVLEDGGMYVLTYTPDYPTNLGPFAAQSSHPGNEILYRSPSGTWETVLSADTGHGIGITSLLEPDESGNVGFRCAKPNRYTDDFFDYRLVRSGVAPSIRVESVFLVYPETVVPIEQVPNYQEILGQKEQQRLNDLGLGIVETP